MRVCDGFDLIEAWRKDGGSNVFVWAPWGSERWETDMPLSVSVSARQWGPAIWRAEGTLVHWTMWERLFDSAPWMIVPTGDGHGLLSKWQPMEMQLAAPDHQPFGLDDTVRGKTPRFPQVVLETWCPVSVEVDWLREHKENNR